MKLVLVVDLPVVHIQTTAARVVLFLQRSAAKTSARLINTALQPSASYAHSDTTLIKHTFLVKYALTGVSKAKCLVAPPYSTRERTPSPLNLLTLDNECI